MIYAIIVSLISTINSSTDLLPEAQPFIQVKPINEKQMDQNAYVYLMAIDAVDDNYFDLGKKIILQGNKITQKAVKEHNDIILEKDRENSLYKYERLVRDWKINNKNYKYACYELDNENCVNDVLKDLKSVGLLLDKNKKLLKRYEHAIQQLDYDSYPPMTMNVLIPDFSILMMFSSLRQAQAIQKIQQGNIIRGIEILQQEINFSKCILRSNAGLIDKMVAVRLLLTQYHTIEVLLDQTSIEKYLTNDQLIKLMTPLTNQEEQGIVSALENELYYGITYFQTLSFDHFDGLFFNRNRTINDLFIISKSLIKQAKITLPEARNTYQNLLNYQEPQVLCESEQIFCIFKIYKKYGFNLLGGILLETAKPDYKAYVFRLYGLQSYLALVNAKLLIKQQHIAKEKIPQFLESLGDKAKNPYTGQPFKWDKTTSTLSTESISSDIIHSLNHIDKSRLHVSITFN